MIRGERLIEQSDSWFSAKIIKVMHIFFLEKGRLHYRIFSKLNIGGLVAQRSFRQKGYSPDYRLRCLKFIDN